MSDQIRVELEGGEELRAKLQELGQKAAGVLEKAGQAGADVIVRAANERAPGPHIESEVVEVGTSSVVVAVGPDDDHWYYRYVEFGAGPHDIQGHPLVVFYGDEGLAFRPGVRHPGMGARPFLRPAIDESEDAAIAALSEVLRREIEKVGA